MLENTFIGIFQHDFFYNDLLEYIFKFIEEKGEKNMEENIDNN